MLTLPDRDLRTIGNGLELLNYWKDYTMIVVKVHYLKRTDRIVIRVAHELLLIIIKTLIFGTGGGV